jgi:DHA1 family bicyclomycin/chloramphenicol resistance-like MFS transporter
MTLTVAPRHRAVPQVDGSVRLRFLLMCAFIACASPLAIDLYLASLPAIQRDLRTTPGMVQLTLTAYLVGIAIGQPLWGPLSDRFGRRPTLVASNAVTVVSSLVVVQGPPIERLIASRFVQALSAASGMVIARAMISDRAQGFAGIRALAAMMAVHGMVPVLSPALGGVLSGFVPWRGVLAVLAGVVLVQLVVSVVAVPETLPRSARAVRLDYRDLGRVVRRPAYLTYALTLGLMVGSLMSYLASAPFVYQRVLGFSPLGFGVTFGVTALGMLAAGSLSAALARRHHHPARTAGAGLVGAVSSAILVIAVGAGPWPVLVVGPVFAHAFFGNLVMGNCMGLAMEQARGLPGAGSAMLGLFMFGTSAVATPLVALGGGVSSAVPMGVAMTTASVLAATAFAVGRRWIAAHPAVEAAFAREARRPRGEIVTAIGTLDM